MDYEKKYKESLERARKLYDSSEYACEMDSYVTIFPELKENEDERMRAMAIKAVYAPEAQSCIRSWGIDPDDVIAWLEKQGEQKPAWSEEDEKLLNSALWHVKNSCGNGGKNSGEFEVYNWLKTLKERMKGE